MALKFRKPKIRKYKDGKWFVEYYYFNPDTGKFKRFKVYEDINTYTGSERLSYARDLRDAVHYALKTLGYNPFETESEIIQNPIELKVETTPTITELIEKFMATKVESNLSIRTVRHYQTFINHFTNWLKETKNTNKEIGYFNEEKINEHLKYVRDLRKWRGNTFNNHRDAFFILFNWLNENEYTDRKLIPKRLITMRNDTTRNEYYHGEVRNKVREELVKHPVLDRVCRAIYYTCLRPYEELCHIKIEDIDFTNRLIKIKTTVGKTGYRFVPICEEFGDMLNNELNISEYPLEYYIFSRKAMPGPNKVPVNYFTQQYKLQIKAKLNLGEEYTMYSWKHTRVTDLLMNGFSDAEVMDLTGHRDTSSYDHYKRNLGQKINSKIKGKTMDF